MSSRNVELKGLLAQINRDTNSMVEWLDSNDVNLSSSTTAATQHDLLSHQDSRFNRLRSSLLDQTYALSCLVRGPRESIMELTMAPFRNATLQLLTAYNLFALVPLPPHAITYTALAEAATLSLTLIERLVNHAITFDLFAQTPDGRVAHSPASALIGADADLRSWVSFISDEGFPSAAAAARAVEKYGATASSPAECAFSVHLGARVGMFEYFAGSSPAQVHSRTRFASAMRSFSTGSSTYAVQHVLDGYPWATLDPGATVVDVGGGRGHVAIALARANPGLRCEVQDVSDTVALGAAEAPADVQDRVTFVAQSFLEPQATTLADGDRGPRVFFLRWVIHDWADDLAITILQHLADALRPERGDRIILNEELVPKPREMTQTGGVGEVEGSALPSTGAKSESFSRRAHDVDLHMLIMMNGQERTRTQFNWLCTRTGLELCSVFEPVGSQLALLELRRAA